MPPSSPARGWLIAIAIAAAFYAAVAPTLSWTQFHDPIENLNIATALEMRHGGPLLVPTLQGFPRLAKPPLTAWMTALSIQPATVATLDATDPEARAEAYARFTQEVRRPALLSASLLLIAAFWIGHLCGGERTGTFTALVCASQYLFLRHCRLATTDIQLALWVGVANAFLVLCVMRQRRWLGCLGVGISMGFVLMAKGPVGLVQTVMPMLVFAVILRWQRPDRQPLPWKRWMAPAIVGLLLMLAIGGWWFALVAMKNPDMGAFWLKEVSRVDADTVPPGPWFKHFVSQYLMLPWVMWMVIGAVMAVVALRSRTLQTKSAEESRDHGVWTAILGFVLLVLPLIVMSFAKDRFQRYLIPLSPAAALLAAGPLVEYVRGRLNGYWIAIVHWAIVLVLAVGMPIAMGLGAGKSQQAVDGGPLLGGLHAGVIAATGLLLVIVGIMLQRRRRDAMVWVTFVIMLGFQAVYYRGLGKNVGGRCELAGVADEIATQYPDAQIYVLRGRNKNVISVYGNELSIYLNRPVNFAPRTDAVPTSDRPQVMLLVRGKNDPALGPIPSWEPLKILRGGNAKYVLLRLPKSAPTTAP